MKLFTREAWRTARPVLALSGAFNAELFARLTRSKIPWTQVPVPHYPRRAGKQTGASIAVVLRSFRDLLALRRVVRVFN
jgi:hypothetical protein